MQAKHVIHVMQVIQTVVPRKVHLMVIALLIYANIVQRTRVIQALGVLRNVSMRDSSNDSSGNVRRTHSLSSQRDSREYFQN